MFNRPFQIMIIELRNLQKTILGLFFSFVFSLLAMYFTMSSVPIEQQREAIQLYFPISLALGIAPLALLTFPASISKEYEAGVFLRYKFFDISLVMVIASKVVLYFLLMIFQIILILVFAISVFHLTFPSFAVSSIFFSYISFPHFPCFS